MVNAGMGWDACLHLLLSILNGVFMNAVELQGLGGYLLTLLYDSRNNICAVLSISHWRLLSWLFLSSLRSWAAATAAPYMI